MVIVDGGQSGLVTAFGLLSKRVSNILVIDETREGLEGPWQTYARMVTQINFSKMIAKRF